MKGHPREGDAALLSYSISKGPELSNPMDASSEPTGNTIFVVDECYGTPPGSPALAGPTENWPEMASAAPAWFAKAKIVTLHNGTIVQALWSGHESASIHGTNLRAHKSHSWSLRPRP